MDVVETSGPLKEDFDGTGKEKDDSNMFRSLMSLFKKPVSKTNESSNKSNKAEKRIHGSSNGVSFSDDKRADKAAHNRDLGMTCFAIEEQRIRAGFPPTCMPRNALDIRMFMIRPSDAAVLKYLACMKLAATTEMENRYKTTATRSSLKRSKCARDSEICEAKECKNVNDELADQISSGTSSPSLLSFPVTLGAHNNWRKKEDDIYISTLRFRSFSRDLVLRGEYDKLREILAQAIPESLFIFTEQTSCLSGKTATRSEVNGRVAFSETWIMLHVLEFLEVRLWSMKTVSIYIRYILISCYTASFGRYAESH